MQIIILLGFMVALVLPELRVEKAPPVLLAVAVGLYILGAAAFGKINTFLALRTIADEQKSQSSKKRRLSLVGAFSRAWLIGGLAGVILLGYGRVVMEQLGRYPLLGEIIVIAPFVLAVILTWLMEFPFHKTARDRVSQQHIAMGGQALPQWTLGQYLIYYIRHYLLLFAVPVGLIVFVIDSLAIFVYPFLPAEFREIILLGGVVISVGLVFIFAPLLIVRIWKTTPLPEGELRDMLERMCAELNLRYRDILIWQSRSVVTNAAAMGLLGSLRYILLSDGLLENLDARQVRSIFAHETGHIKSHHIFYSGLFMFATVILGGSLGEYLAELTNQESFLLAPFLLVIVFGGFGFGWISRRFERQCDVVAAWVGGMDGQVEEGDGKITQQGAAVFSQALQRVGQLNGVALGQRNWRHGSIGWRVSYILQLGASGGNREEIDRVVRLVKIGLWIFFITATALGLWRFGA